MQAGLPCTVEWPVHRTVLVWEFAVPIVIQPLEVCRKQLAPHYVAALRSWGLSEVIAEGHVEMSAQWGAIKNCAWELVLKMKNRGKKPR